LAPSGCEPSLFSTPKFARFVNGIGIESGGGLLAVYFCPPSRINWEVGIIERSVSQADKWMLHAVISLNYRCLMRLNEKLIDKQANTAVLAGGQIEVNSLIILGKTQQFDYLPRFFSLSVSRLIPNGSITCVEIDPIMVNYARQYLEKASQTASVVLN